MRHYETHADYIFYPFLKVAINLANGVFCSGTIVHQNHVVTAARCVFDPNMNLTAANTITIRAGVGALTANDARINVNAIFPHPRYNHLTNENNIAVLRVHANTFLFFYKRHN